MKSPHLQPVLQSTEAVSPRRSGKRRSKARWASLVTAVVFGALIWAALKTSRLGYESPDYQVTLKEGDLEVRNYPAIATVSTPMGTTEGQSGMNGGFGRLFQYITGSNEGGAKVAMTTPVLIDSSQGGDKKESMNFVLPKAVAAAGAPAPTGDKVSLREFSGGDFAVIRFHGFRNDDAIDGAEADLRKWIEAKSWTAQGEAMLAFYDPPWTPEFLRRNEVMIRIER